MAATDARPVPKKNVAFRWYLVILDADGDLVTGAAGLDSEVSVDGAAFADCTNEATEIGSTGIYFLDLTAGEMNGDAICVQVKTSTSGAKTTVGIFYPEEAGDIRVDVTSFGGTAGTFASGRPEVNTSHFGGTAGTFSGGRPEVNVSHFGGTAGTFAGGRAEVNTSHIAGSAISQASGVANVNVVQVSGDSVAADNLEAEYDGTGYKSYLRRSTAQAGAAGTITLDASASATDDLYNGSWVAILSGTGVGQARLITDYVGSTKVATISPNWITNPSSDSVFIIFPNNRIDVGAWLGTIAAAPTVAGVPEVDITHYGGSAGTFSGGRPEVNTSHIAGSAVSTTTAQIGVNVVQISTDAVAADNAELFFDGTGYNAANSTVGTVTTVSGTVSANVTQVSGDSAAADNLEAEFDGTGYKSYLRRNTAQSGAAGSITLDAAASGTDDLYNGQLISVIGGTGLGQTRLITDYNGTTKAATISPAWIVNPSSDSVFLIHPLGRVDLALWLGTAPNALQSGRVDSYIGALAAAVIAAANFAAGAIDAAAVATGAIDADALATDAAQEIRDAVWGKAMVELAGVPGVTGNVLEALEWIFLLARNRVTQTSTTQTLRNDANSANIATSAVSDDGTTFVRDEWA